MLFVMLTGSLTERVRIEHDLFEFDQKPVCPLPSPRPQPERCTWLLSWPSGNCLTGESHHPERTRGGKKAARCVGQKLNKFVLPPIL